MINVEDNKVYIYFLLDPEIHPQHEEYWGHVNPIGPRACYDEGKRVAETLCYAYHKQVRCEINVYITEKYTKYVNLS